MIRYDYDYKVKIYHIDNGSDGISLDNFVANDFFDI